MFQYFRALQAAIVLVAGSLFAGCAYTNEITRTRQDIEQYAGIDAQTGVVVSIGPGLFHTAGFLARFVDDEDAQTASRLAYSIRRIKAGIYPLEHSTEFEDLDIPELKRFKKRGWELALKVVDYDEIGWILYRERNRRVRDLFVVVLTENELVLARIQGNLTELLDLALEEVENEGAPGFFEDWSDWEH